MSHRDSDSKRRHSKFDREPSPKRHRRDGKHDREREREREKDRERERERERERATTNGGGDQNHTDRNQRNPLLPHNSKQEPADAGHKKSNQNEHHGAPKHSSQPPRSRSYHQRDERGSAGQVGRSASRREPGGRVFTQSKENNEKVETSQSREQRDDEKSQAKLDDDFQRRDGFQERKDGPPPTMRKRPAFREKKIPVDSGDANAAVTVTVKSSHTDHPPERNERKEERSNNPSHPDRPEKQIAEDRASNKREARRDGFSSRVRYGGSGGIDSYRGRDRFDGSQGFHPIKTQTEKWKHDLYQEVNKDPIPKNEDDQIAKLEALLSS